MIWTSFTENGSLVKSNSVSASSARADRRCSSRKESGFTASSACYFHFIF
jgi:hypothetical protein